MALSAALSHFGRPAQSRRLSALWRDSEGATMIEYAFVGPPFIALVLACLHTALVYLAQEGLETTAESAARLLLTGQAQTLQTYSGSTVTTGMTAAQFKQAICGTLTYKASATATGTTAFGGTMLPPFLTCDRLTVNVTVSSSYATASTGAPTFTYNSSGTLTSTGTGYTTTTGGNGQNLIQVVQLIYLWPTVTGPLGFSLVNQTGGNRMLVATQVLSTESYLCPTGITSC